MKAAILGLLVVMGLCSGCATMPGDDVRAGNCGLSLNVNLSGVKDMSHNADVAINGVVVGTTDGAGNIGIPLEAKTYEVKVTAKGYKPYQERIRLVGGDSGRGTYLKVVLMPEND